MNTATITTPEATNAASVPTTPAATAASHPLDLAEVNRQLAEVQAHAKRLTDVAAEMKREQEEAAKAEAAAQLAAKQAHLREALAQLGADSAAKGYAVVRALFAGSTVAAKPKRVAKRVVTAKPKVAAAKVAPKVAAKQPRTRAKVNARGHKLVVRGPYPAAVWAGIEAALREGASVRSLHEETGVGQLSIQNRRKKIGLVGKVAGGLNVVELIKAGKVQPLLKAA